MRWLLFLLVAVASWTARVLGQHLVDDPAGSSLLALGTLVIGGVLAGELARSVRLPRITGYLVLGVLAGPHLVGLVTAEDHRQLRLFEELALGLIALTAGGEFRLSGLRPRLPALLAITASHTVGVFLVVSAAVWVVAGWIPVLGPLDRGQLLAAAALLGVIAVAKSPATTIAVITETRARGDLVDIVLGVTILKDIVILLLFTWVGVLAKAWARSEPVGAGMLHGVGLEIGLSLVVGGLLGALFGAYLVRVGRHLNLTVILLSLVSAELAHQAGLEHLLVCMAAGCTVRNLHPRAAAGFLDALEQSSTPIYVVFFALVGASLDVGVAAVMWAPALSYAGLRLAATWFFTRTSARLAGCSSSVVAYSWMGFVAQAGLSLGFAARIQRDLPEVGPAVATVVVAAVVVNQLVGPMLWAHALHATGEARVGPQPKRPREPRASLTTSRMDRRKRTL